MAAPYRRKNYFTKKGFQTRFVLPFLLASFLANIVTVALFIVLARNRIDSLLFSMRLPSANAGALLFPIALIAGMTAVVAVAFLFFRASRSAYHKIAGPLNSIRDDLRIIEQGNLSTRVVLRESDEFKDFAEEINAMAAELNHRFAGLKEDALRLSQTSEAFIAARKTGAAGPPRQELMRRIRSLEERIGAFKL